MLFFGRPMQNRAINDSKSYESIAFNNKSSNIVNLPSRGELRMIIFDKNRHGGRIKVSELQLKRQTNKLNIF
jgi:hypothetical protein